MVSMMAEIGHFTLALAWLLALYGCFGGALAAARNINALSKSAACATVAVGLLSTASIFCLGWLFIHNDYSVQYVWQFSNREMPNIYKISAIWGGMDGSMLLWAMMLAAGSAFIAARRDLYPRALLPWTISALNSAPLFFLTVVLFFVNPFRYLQAPGIPFDGNGLNPLLQNPLMAVHPPSLYAGFTLFSVPFSFCIGALLSGNLTNEWIRITRRWTLIAWIFLTGGIILGGHWAYVELGWGGFWAWDPVENASFLPWLTATAFIHSVMVQERKNMLKAWNVWLIVLTYGLTVFGTFLTRSGIVQSVHAFASTDIGWIFLVYLGLLFAGTAALTYWRRVELRSERKIESIFSREAAFLLNNLVFLSICFATLWGVMFPVLSEALTGSKQAVGIPYFNAVNIPLFQLMLLLMAVGPLIAWKRATWQSMRRTFVGPFLGALCVAIILTWAGIESYSAITAYALSCFAIFTIFAEMHRGLSVQKATAPQGIVSTVPALMRRHRVRYGGYIVHIGVAIVAIAITASMAHKIEKEFTLSPGESYEVGRFAITLDRIEPGATSNYEYLRGYTSVSLRGNGKAAGKLNPELRFYPRNKENTTEVALKVTLRDDLYLVMAGLNDEGTRASFKVFVNPLQVWLWFGGIIMLCGTLVILMPQRSRALTAAETTAAPEVI